MLIPLKAPVPFFTVSPLNVEWRQPNPPAMSTERLLTVSFAPPEKNAAPPVGPEILIGDRSIAMLIDSQLCPGCRATGQRHIIKAHAERNIGQHRVSRCYSGRWLS